MTLWKRFALVLIGAISMTCALLVAPNLWFHSRLQHEWNSESHALPTQTPQTADRLCLIFALDGVPFGVIQEMYNEGDFNDFFPPGALISTFPSLTRPAFSKMLIGGKPKGYERLYFNHKNNQIEGLRIWNKVFLTENTSDDYNPKLHFMGFPGYIAYVFPNRFTETTLSVFKDRLTRFQGNEFIAYIGVSDPIAHVEGKAGLKRFLKKINALLKEVRRELDRPLEVVLFSDHGNNLIPNQRVELAPALEQAGFRDSETIQDERDVILLRNGYVSMAALHTVPESAPKVSEVLSRIEGVDFLIYREQDELIVEGAAGSAIIRKKGETYAYHPLWGDPLQLLPFMTRMSPISHDSGSTFFAAKDWWSMTQNHRYPDPLRRIWVGMNDLVQHPPTLLVSFQEGYAFGPPLFDQGLVQRQGTHGALLASHSRGFLLTDFMKVPSVNRPEFVANLLEGAQAAKKRSLQEK